MIIFKNIRYKNFLSTGNQFIEIPLNKNKTTLIIGKNGAGKSTILDALTFGLFGKPFRKINKPQLVNSIIQKNTVVEIDFSIGNNEYRIIRGIKPAIFEIYKNDDLIDQSAESIDYQEYLEKNIFRFNQKTFSQVVILGSANFQPFMQLTTAQRREIIEDILNLKIFSSMNTILKDQISVNNSLLSSTLTDKKIVEEKISLTYDHIQAMKNNDEMLIIEKQDHLQKADDDIKKLKEKHDLLQKQIEEKSTKIFDITPLKSNFRKLNDLIIKLNSKKEAIEENIEYLTHNDNCVTCKQEITNGYRCEKIDTYQETIASYAAEIKIHENEIEEIKQKLDRYEKDNLIINDLEVKASKIVSEINGLKKYIKSIEKEIDQFIDKKKIDANADTKLIGFKLELEEIKIKYDQLDEEKNILGMAASLLKDGGIKAKIIKQYIPIINNLINNYLISMNFMCQYELDEEFNEKLKSRFHDEFSYFSFSEGEKYRINLAILFAWRAVAKLRNSVNTNLLILDEVMDSSLDIGGTDEFIKLVNAFTEENNVVIISHKTDQLMDKFEKTITFGKIKNFSRII